MLEGQYSLIVEGGGIRESRPLMFISKGFSFSALLNKAIFRPGDLLQFKIFATDSETKAVTPECSSVFTIEDPNKNIIVKNTNLDFKKGTYESYFKLPAKALSGVWSLSLKCDQEVFFLK